MTSQELDQHSMILTTKAKGYILLSGPCGAFCYLGHFKKLRIIIIIIIKRAKERGKRL